MSATRVFARSVRRPPLDPERRRRHSWRVRVSVVEAFEGPAGFLLALAEPWRARASGILEVRREGVTTLLYLDEGEPVFAESSALAETLGRVLLLEGKLTEAQYAEVVRRMTESIVEAEPMRFGEVAVALGFVHPITIQEALSSQVRRRLLACVGPGPQIRHWLPDTSIVDDVGSFPQDVPRLLAEGVASLDDAEREALHVMLGRPAVGGEDPDPVAYYGLPPSDARAWRLRSELPSDHELLARLAILDGLTERGRASAQVPTPADERAAWLAAERQAAERAAAERDAADRAAERAAVERAAVERAAVERAAVERAELERRAAERAALDRAVAERDAAARAERAAVERAERMAADRAERAALEAAERAAAERAMAERAAAERAAAERAAAERAAAERAAVESASRAAATAERATSEHEGPRRRPTPTQDAAARAEAERERAKLRAKVLAQRARPPTPVAEPASPAKRPSVIAQRRRLVAETALRNGRAHLEAGRFEPAAREFERACELENEPEITLHLTFVRWRLGDASLGEALERDAKALLRREPQNAFAPYVLAHRMMDQGEDEKALKAFRRAAQLDPTLRDAERHARLLASRLKK
jgi:tetratricopeptide (TPR) repeat protein